MENSAMQNKCAKWQLTFIPFPGYSYAPARTWVHDENPLLLAFWYSSSPAINSG